MLLMISWEEGMESVRNIDVGNQPKEDCKVCLASVLTDPDNDRDKKRKGEGEVL